MNSPTLTPTPGLEDSASPLKRKGFARSASRKSTKTSASCSPTSFPECPITEASSESLPGAASEEQWLELEAFVSPIDPEPFCFPSETEWLSRRDGLMSLRAECLASLRVLSDKCAALLTHAGNGPQQPDWCAAFDPGSQSLRTRQASLFSKTGEPGTELCVDWSRSGMICGGTYFPLPRLVQDISESASLLLLPTVTTSTGGIEPIESGQTGRKLVTVLAAMLPTLRANKRGVPDNHGNTAMWQPAFETSEGASPQKTGGMKFTLEFQSWFMGYHPDWLKRLRAVPATQLCRKRSNPSPAPSAPSSKGAE